MNWNIYFHSLICNCWRKLPGHFTTPVQLCLFVIVFVSSHTGHAFTHSNPDSLLIRSGKIVMADTTKPTDLTKQKARKAALLSACLPGMGQVYNRKIWKVPLIYGAFAGMGYFYLYNNGFYQRFHKALLYRNDDDPATIDEFSQLDNFALARYKNQFKKYRDLSAAGFVAVYLLNVLDAAVDSHFSNFKTQINDDLSLSIAPYSHYATNFSIQDSYTGFSLKLNFSSKRSNSSAAHRMLKPTF